MGCDIHMFVESGVPRDEDGEVHYWSSIAYGQFSMDRNYLMFSVLAGIRGGRR